MGDRQLVNYRTDDNTRWGAGKGSDLTPTEVDRNFWDIWLAITALQAIPHSAEISYFEVSGKQFYVHLSDHTTLGPYDLPVATFNDKVSWSPTTFYDALDTFSVAGTLYFVNVAHTSAASFDPSATDGLGNNLYVAMISSPGNALPVGGSTGQILEKSTGVNYAVTWGWKLPVDGATGQFLRKASGTNQDATWQDVNASEIDFVPATGSSLTATNVADALEEAANLGGSEEVLAEDVTYTAPTGSALTATNVQDAIDQVEDQIVTLQSDVAAKPSLSDFYGKQSIWLPANIMIPRTTNGAASGTVEMSVSKTMVKTLDFDASTREYAQCDFVLPSSWDRGTLTCIVYWSTSTGSGDVVWGVSVKSLADNDLLDVSWPSAVAITDTTNGNDTMNVSDESNTITVSNVPNDTDYLTLLVQRVGDAGTDTLSTDARLHGIKVFYTTDAVNEN